MIEYKINEILDWPQVFNLYREAQWSNYTQDLEMLKQAYHHSLLVIAAWQQDELIGIIRVVGDGLTILYIQDLIVKIKFRRQGIGQELLQQVNLVYPEVRQKVLLTDSVSGTLKFYQSCGYKTCEEHQCTACVQFK